MECAFNKPVNEHRAMKFFVEAKKSKGVAAFSANKSKSRAEWRKQSPLNIIIWLVKVLPAATALSSGAVWLLKQFAIVSSGVYVTAVVATAIATVALSVLHWKNNIWSIDSENLRTRYCFLSLEIDKLPKYAFSSLELSSGILNSLTGTVKASLDTYGTNHKPAKTMLLPKRTAFTLRKLFAAEKDERIVHSDTLSALIAAAAGSSFYTGILISVPIVAQLGKYIGTGLQDMLYSELTKLAEEIYPYAPALSMLAIIPLISWGVHFLINFTSFVNHSAQLSSGGIALKGGLIKHREHLMPASGLAAVGIKRTLLLAALGRESCYAYTLGGKRLTVLPAVKRTSHNELAQLLPHGTAAAYITPQKADSWRYYAWWLTGIGALLLIWLRISAQLGSAITAPPFIFVLLLMLWRSAAGYFAAKHSGIMLDSETVSITGLSGLSLYELRIPRNMVAQLKITRNPWQRASGLCSVYIRAQGCKKGIWCRYLPADRSFSLADRLK